MMHEVIPQLKGRICLIPGNHEPTGMRKYFDLFQDVRGYIQRQGFIMSHIPIHPGRSEEHTSELQSLMRISYAVFCLKKKTKQFNMYYYHNSISNTTTTYTHK